MAFNSPILRVDSLQVDYRIKSHWSAGLDRISLCQKREQNIGIIGESGSGKTTFAHSIMGLIGSPHKVSGRILYKGIDLLSLPYKQKKELLWKDISIVFQNSLEVLNPVMTIGRQITERLIEIRSITEKEAQEEQIRLLEMVELEAGWKDAYPHQLSGGMRQRVLIAMAISCNPNLIIFDEPTSSMDAILKKHTIGLIKKLQQELGFSMIIISHDLLVVRELAHGLHVMYSGRVVESGSVKDILNYPRHPYTRGLINSSAEIFPYKDLWGIPGEIIGSGYQGCVFADRCTQSIKKCHLESPHLCEVDTDRQVACHRGGVAKLLDVIDISKKYTIKNKEIEAVKKVSFSINHGETVGLVGQSGSGKSTVAKIAAGFLLADEGDIIFDQNQVLSGNAFTKEGGIQLVLQDPFSSLSNRLKVEDVVKESLDINSIGSKEERITRVKKALKDVQLPNTDEFLKRYCNTLSGGQRQRVAVARALVIGPKLLIADEVTSMLDVSTQANMMRLLKGLQNTHGFAMLFVTHDLHLARKICERIIVLNQGKVVDSGSASQITEESCCQYTEELIGMGLEHMGRDGN